MWNIFIFENFHFAVNVFAALVSLAVAWLYFDAWIGSKRTQEIARSIGFLLLGLSLFIHAVSLETTLFTGSLFQGNLVSSISVSIKTAAYMLILFSLFLEKLQPKPKYTQPALAASILIPSFVFMLQPILSFAISMLYLRRATVGLERHVKQVAFAFLALSLSELFALGVLYRDTVNSQLYTLLAPFGLVWVFEHIFFLIAFLLLGIWIFRYLLKQFQTQLFMFFSLLSLSIFLLTTVAFTGLLLSNMKDETLTQLTVNAKTLQYALMQKGEERAANNDFIAAHPGIKNALIQRDSAALADLAEDFLVAKNTSSLLIADSDGIVLARGEDRDKKGDSILSNEYVKRSFQGETISSIITKPGVLAPEIYFFIVTPVKAENGIVGVVITETPIDSTFVDTVNKSTNLSASVYADDTISATTLVNKEGSRLVGAKELRTDVKNSVLLRQLPYAGEVNWENTPYFVVYVPLVDQDNTVVGMISTAKEQSSVLLTATRSIELTFIFSVLFIIISAFPSFAITKYLTKQI